MAENEVAVFLRRVGRDLGRTDAQMEPIVNLVVNEHWVDTLDGLKNLSDSAWADLKLPVRLVDEIKRRLRGNKEDDEERRKTKKHHQTSTASSSRGESTAGGKKSRGGEEVEEEEADERRKSPVRYSAAPVSWPAPLEALEAVQREVPRDSLRATLQTLVKLVDNILANPEDERKRKLRLTNDSFRQKVGKYPCCRKFLLAVGFLEAGEFMVMEEVFVMRLTDCHHALAELLTHLGVDPPTLPYTPGFNPFQSSIATTQKTPFSKVQASVSDRSLDPQHINSEIERIRIQHKGDQLPEVPINPRVGLPNAQSPKASSSSSSSASSSRPHVASDFEDVGSSAGLTNADISRVKQLLTEGPKFRSRAKQELEQLQRRPVITTTTLRVQFPDKVTLDLDFRPADTVYKVRRAIDEFLDIGARARPWCLFQTPPVRVLSDSKTLMEELGSVSLAKVFFKLEDGEPCSQFLSDEVIAGHI